MSLAVLFVMLLILFPLTVWRNAVAQGKPEKERIRIGYAARAVTHSIPYLANETGLFRDERLQVEVVRTAGAVSPMALISGDTDFATMSAFLLIPVSVRNQDVVILGGLTPSRKDTDHSLQNRSRHVRVEFEIWR